MPHGFPERGEFSLLPIIFFRFQPEFIIIVNLESISGFTNHYHADYFIAVVLLLKKKIILNSHAGEIGATCGSSKSKLVMADKHMEDTDPWDDQV